MITKQQLVESMTRECDIAQHLFTKLSPGSFDYRPSPNQRSTLELLRYLSMIGIASTRCMAASNWKLLGEYTARAEQMAPDDFPARMAHQKAELEQFFETVTEDQLASQPAKLPGGATLPLGAALINGPVKWLAAYKLQLFLYAKATGANEIGTANAWAGIDWKG